MCQNRTLAKASAADGLETIADLRGDGAHPSRCANFCPEHLQQDSAVYGRYVPVCRMTFRDEFPYCGSYVFSLKPSVKIRRSASRSSPSLRAESSTLKGWWHTRRDSCGPCPIPNSAKPPTVIGKLAFTAADSKTLFRHDPQTRRAAGCPDLRYAA